MGLVDGRIRLATALVQQLPRLLLRAQVLDDSTDPHTRQLVDDHAALWQERGVAVDVVRRTNRAGYKAGALKEVDIARTMHTGRAGWG